ncbi:fucolectin-4-like [Lissotriton helveticus]
MKAALTAAFVCTLLLVMNSAPTGLRRNRKQRLLQKIRLHHQYRMKAAPATAFVCTLLLGVDLAVIDINPQCLFPFIDKGVTYLCCTKKDHSTMGCAPTSNFHSDPRWIKSNGRGQNVAPRGRAIQSSVLAGEWSAYAINAIDGNKDPNYPHGSCTHTDYDYGPWWRVDLLRTYKVYFISVTARDGFTERMNGAQILVGNSLTNYGNDNKRCGSISSIAAGATQTFHCYGMVGRYVNVIIRGRKEYLTLCEVQVFAEPKS